MGFSSLEAKSNKLMKIDDGRKSKDWRQVSMSSPFYLVLLVRGIAFTIDAAILGVKMVSYK